MIPTPDNGELGQVLLRGQHSILQLIAACKPRQEVLDGLCTIVEDVCPGTLCSILLVTSDGQHLRHGAGPNLPEGYCRLINGIAISPGIGSCGTAAYRRELVVVDDIQHDPLWRGYEALALEYGLASCASIPICCGPDARVLGTFAIYHRTPGPFAAVELDILRSISELAAIAILNDRREQALRDGEARLTRVVAVSGVLETVLGLDGKWQRVPQAFCNLLARSKQELLELRLQDVIHPRDLEIDHAEYQRLISGQIESFQTEDRLLRKDGTSVWAALNCSVVRDEDGKPTHLLAYIMDVTRRKHAEETLRTSQKMESFGLLAPGLAHDFNNLLTAILCNASLAQDNVRGQAPASEAINTIETIARRAADLVRQTLSYAATGRSTKRTIDLNQIAKETIQVLAASFLKNTEIELKLAQALPSVLGDPAQVHQVVMNIVINAAQAIGDDKGTVRVETRTEEIEHIEEHAQLAEQGLAPGTYVVLEIADTGSGITPAVMQKIFEPFFTTKPSGRGVGLAVSMGILREHRAGLEVATQVGHGSVFRMYFPASKIAETRTTARPAELYWPGVHGKVLLVDDDRLIRNAIGHMLRAQGFETLEAVNGTDALLQLAKSRSEISLIVLDLTSPRLGGRDALPIIRERWPDLDVIVMSGVDEADLEGLSKTLVLRKPFNLVDLKRAMFGAANAPQN